MKFKEFLLVVGVGIIIAFVAIALLNKLQVTSLTLGSSEITITSIITAVITFFVHNYFKEK